MITFPSSLRALPTPSFLLRHDDDGLDDTSVVPFCVPKERISEVRSEGAYDNSHGMNGPLEISEIVGLGDLVDREVAFVVELRRGKGQLCFRVGETSERLTLMR